MSENSQLIDRAQHIAVLLESYITGGVETPYEKGIIYLLHHQYENGSWATSDYPPWTDILTAFTIQILTSAGFHWNSTWEITRSDHALVYTGGLEQALEYLISSQQPNGHWGEDFFDTCQVLKAVLPYQGHGGVGDAVNRGLQYVRQQIDEDFKDERAGEWFGPGFLAVAVDVFNSLKDQNRVSDLLARVYTFQGDDIGAFCAPDLISGQTTNDVCVWHTSLVLLAMHSLGIPSEAKKLASALAWLESTQNPDGSWGKALTRHRAIFTAYGVMALAAFDGIESSNVQLGISWLEENQTPDGRVGGMEGTVMSVLAFSRVYARPILTSIPLDVLVDTRQLMKQQHDTILAQGQEITSLNDTLGKAQELSIQHTSAMTKIVATLDQQGKELKETNEQNTRLLREIEDWKKHWEDFPLKLSNKFLTVSGWVVAIVSLVIGIITFRPQLEQWTTDILSILSMPTSVPIIEPSQTPYSPTPTPSPTRGPGRSR